jgi:hypothetical protein
MIERDDVLAEIRAELNSVPSAQFEARVRQRIDAEAIRSRATRGYLLSSAAALLLAFAVWMFQNADESSDLRIKREVTSRIDGPAAVAIPESVLVPERAVAHSIASRPVVAPAAETPARPFDPFRDVLIAESDRQALHLPMSADVEELPPGVKPLSIDEPVKVVALSEISELVIAPLPDKSIDWATP